MHTTLSAMIPRLSTILALSSSLVAAAPTQATVVIPDGTIIGTHVNGVEYFRGIPYAAAPIGSRRLRPPIPLASGFGTLDATGIGPSCPQMAFADIPPLFYQAISDPVVAAGLFLGSNVPGTETEDCLTVSVSRPKGTAPGAKLPVLFWMHGGGFQIGSGQPYNASVLLPRGVETGKPFILVTVNYRLSAFGFLGGKEVEAAGVANLGLLDQRRALEWVADNIAAFGGDPTAVTLWGESAGALSVFDQMALYDGNNKYKGRALFRAGIMNSGSIHLPDPVDGDRAQAVFDAVYTSVASASNCTANQDKLECLRQADYQTFLTASNKVPIFLSYNSIALSYGPRPDGKTLTASPDELVKTKKFAKVPVIVGDVEDEGTVFALYQANITTEAALKTYLGTVILPHASASQINALVATYPFKNGTAGAPFGQPNTLGPYPEFKRIGAILGDQLFLLARRFFLENLPANMPAWSFLATWERDTPLVGTFHTDDLPRMFYGLDDASRAMQDRFIAFTSSMDPNKAVATAPKGHRSVWPLWREGKALLELAKNETKVVKDDFRKESYKVFKDNIKSFRN